MNAEAKDALDHSEPFDPPGLPHMLFIETAQARGHNPGPAQIANHSTRILSVHDRQSAYVVSQHLRGSAVQRFVWIRNHNVARTSIEYAQSSARIGIKRTHHIASGDD